MKCFDEKGNNFYLHLSNREFRRYHHRYLQKGKNKKQNEQVPVGTTMRPLVVVIVVVVVVEEQEEMVWWWAELGAIGCVIQLFLLKFTGEVKMVMDD